MLANMSIVNFWMKLLPKDTNKKNLTSIKDKEFLEKITQEVNKLEKDVKLKEEEILSKIAL